MSEYELAYVLGGVRTTLVVEAPSAAAAEALAPIDAEIISVKFVRRITRGCRQPLPRRL